jgi:hypothetical protein
MINWLKSLFSQKEELLGDRYTKIYCVDGEGNVWSIIRGWNYRWELGSRVEAEIQHQEWFIRNILVRKYLFCGITYYKEIIRDNTEQLYGHEIDVHFLLGKSWPERAINGMKEANLYSL